MAGRVAMSRGAGEAAGRAVDWLERGLPHLAPSSPTGKKELRRLKALCEIGFLISMCSNELRSSTLARRVSELIATASADGRFLSALWHQPNHANLYLPLLYTLAREGRLAPAAMTDLSALLARLRAWGSERIPFRTLDFLFTDYLFTGVPNLDRMEAVTQFGCAVAGLGLANCSSQDDYALTHSIFYLTAFGSRPWPLGADRRRQAALVVRAMGLAAEAREDWDLASEFLASQTMLGSPVETRSIERLVKSQNPDGSWTGPTDLESKLREEGFAAPDEIRFYSDYHTSLVAWMALRVHESPGLFQPGATGCIPPAISSATYGYEALSAEWTGLLNAHRRLAEGDDETPPSEGLLSDPQAILPYLEYHYWRSRLRREAPAVACPDEILPRLEPACRAQSWRQLRCLLLMLGHDGLRPDRIHRVRELVDSALNSMPPSAAGDSSAVDLIICAGLLSVSSEKDGAPVAGSTRIATDHLLLAFLDRDIFTAGPIITFWRPWLEPDLVEEAEHMTGAARSQTLPYGFVFQANDHELRRSLSSETYIHQARIAAAAGTESAEDPAFRPEQGSTETAPGPPEIDTRWH